MNFSFCGSDIVYYGAEGFGQGGAGQALGVFDGRPPPYPQQHQGEGGPSLSFPVHFTEPPPAFPGAVQTWRPPSTQCTGGRQEGLAWTPRSTQWSGTIQPATPEPLALRPWRPLAASGPVEPTSTAVVTISESALYNVGRQLTALLLSSAVGETALTEAVAFPREEGTLEDDQQPSQQQPKQQQGQQDFPPLRSVRPRQEKPRKKPLLPKPPLELIEEGVEWFLSDDSEEEEPAEAIEDAVHDRRSRVNTLDDEDGRYIQVFIPKDISKSGCIRLCAQLFRAAAEHEPEILEAARLRGRRLRAREQRRVGSRDRGAGSRPR